MYTYTNKKQGIYGIRYTEPEDEAIKPELHSNNCILMRESCTASTAPADIDIIRMYHAVESL